MSSPARDNDAFDHARARAGEREHERERLGPLEERLRGLSWPGPPPGARERTLEELHRRLVELDLDGKHPLEPDAEAEAPEPVRRRQAG